MEESKQNKPSDDLIEEEANSLLNKLDLEIIKTKKMPSSNFADVNQKMTIIPTLDISKGRAVLVCEGKVVKDNGDPFERAQFLSINSDFQVVDLDRAREEGDNSEIIKQICAKFPCYVAGGIRNYKIANDFLNNNAKRVVIGTAADIPFLSQIPKNRSIVSFDIDQDFKLYFRGRKELTTITIFDKLDELFPYISFISVTCHYTEGTGKGCDLDKIKEIKNYISLKNYDIKVAAAGGINSLDQIKELVKLNVIPQFGLGLWGGTFTLGDIYAQVMDYERMSNYYHFKDMPILFPCVVVGSDGTTLGLTYADSQGIKESIDSRQCVFYSRERKTKWVKGETSGNYQKITQVGFNCDRTALLFIVEGDNDFCHLYNRSCFNHRNPSEVGMLFLENILKRSLCADTKDHKSYTRKMFENKSLQICKILEEANEVWTASNKDNLISEISDLVYFLTLYSISNNLEVKDICNELKKRHFRLNKQVYITNEVPKSLKMGICLTKHCEKHIFNFLENEGIVVKKSDNLTRSLKYEAHFKKNPQIEILPFLIKPKDAYKFMEYKYMDIVVCYQDVVDNYPVNYKEVSKMKNENLQTSEKENNISNSNSKICAIANLDFNLEEYIDNPDKKLNIFSEYIYLTNQWAEKNKIVAKIMPVNGFTEGFLVQRLCDVVVCVVDSGKTVQENNLKVIDTIYESQIGIFVRKDIAETVEMLL